MAMGTDEIMMDILSRLDVKPLLRFKCVSKFWKTLISEPYFKQKHLNFHSKNESSQKMLFGKIGTFYFSSSCLSSDQIVKDIVHNRVDFPTRPMGRVYCCYNGLFLIGLMRKFPSTLMLWNPSTRERTILPPFVNPSEDQYVYGLGYDSTSDDYKVLKIDHDDNRLIEILALKRGSWRQLDEITRRNIDCITSPLESLKFLHGAFHWYQPKSVGTLNISNETYGEIPLPDPFPPYKWEDDISVLGGMLCLYLNDKITADIWVMKDYGVKESWTKLFSTPSYGYLEPLYMFSNGEVLLRYRNLETKIHKISDGSSGLTNRIWPSDSDGIDAHTITNVIVYTESLISPRLNH